MKEPRLEGTNCRLRSKYLVVSYLVLLLTVKYANWTEVIVNLKKARRIWSQLSRILERKGVDPKTS